jgi:Na+/proline symporter
MFVRLGPGRLKAGGAIPAARVARDPESPKDKPMKLRLALCSLGALAIAGAPALALAQDAAAPPAEASTPVPNPPAKVVHHATKKAHHKTAAATTGATGVTTVKHRK